MVRSGYGTTGSTVKRTRFDFRAQAEKARGLRSSVRGSTFHAKSLAMLVFTPWLTFTAVVVAVNIFFLREPLIVWFVLMCCIGVGALCIVVSSTNEKGPIYMYLGLLVFASVAAGLIFGFFDFVLFLGPFWNANIRGAHYNVLPSEPATAHVDASELSFSSSSRVDLMKVAGYRSPQGDTYCVAPISDENALDKVNYFAVGIGCCGTRSNFRCDDATDPNAASGLVWIKPAFSILPSSYDNFIAAAHEAAAAYSFAVAKEPIFVRWVKDPRVTVETMWRDGFGLMLIAIGIDLVVCIVVGTTLHMIGNKK